MFLFRIFSFFVCLRTWLCLCMCVCFFLSSAIINFAAIRHLWSFVVVIVVAVAFSVVSHRFTGTRPETMHTKMNNAWFIYTAKRWESEWTNERSERTNTKKKEKKQKRKQTRKDIKSNESLFLSHVSDTLYVLLLRGGILANRDTIRYDTIMLCTHIHRLSMRS